ncbi:MAG TPA: type II CAAX endopeptidase family protein [Prolixibacteraceae bacterium]|nr:type II CAAX endopeptidase family protein [Prolixibacteraceae bacterium]
MANFFRPEVDAFSREKYKHPVSQLILVAFISLLSLFVFMLLGTFLAVPFWGMEQFQQLLQATISYNPENVPFLKYLQMVQSIGLFIVPSLILAKIFSGSLWNYLKMDQSPMVRSLFLALILILVSSPFINATGVINSRMSFPDWMSGIEEWMRASEDNAGELTQLFLNTDTIWGLLFNILMIGIIPALGEELLFRGIIQRIFTRWTRNVHLGVWISALLFSALHFQFYGFIPRALLGVMFGYLLAMSGSLWLPVAAHFFNNTIAVLAYYFYDKGILSFDPETLGAESGFGWAAAVSLAGVLSLMVYLFRIEKRKALSDNFA